MHKVEIWKDIDGYNGRYQISNFGRVRTNDYNHTGKTKIMRISKNAKGYCQICLTKNNKRKTHKIHRLVAIAFVSNPNPIMLNCINHKDENKNNNNADNLEWCTNDYNNAYGHRTFKTSIEYAQYDLNGNFIRIWKSGEEINKTTEFSRRQIDRCCDGLISNAYGYIWEKAPKRGTHLKID